MLCNYHHTCAGYCPRPHGRDRPIEVADSIRVTLGTLADVSPVLGARECCGRARGLAEGLGINSKTLAWPVPTHPARTHALSLPPAGLYFHSISYGPVESEIYEYPT